jgi:NTE family protein
VTSGSPLAGRRVGLVLGAGGMIGHAYHAGVLAALEDHLDWDARDADLVVGTSAGSVVGSALRAGIGARDLAARSTGDPLSPEAARLVARSEAAVPGGVPLRPRRARGLPRMAAPGMVARTMLRPFWWNRPGIVLAGAIPAGRVPTDWVSAGIRVLYGDEWSDRPLWIAAVRLSDGRRVVFGRDGAANPPVADAVAASCAIPGFFEPVTIDGERYVDGGAHSPTNADLVLHWSPSQAPAPAAAVGKAAAARATEDLDLVVVSSPMSIGGGGGRRRPAIDAPARRLCRLYLAREIARIRRRGIPVIAFQPTGDDLAAMGVNAMDPDRRAPVTRQARASAAAKLARDDVQAILRELAPVGVSS